MAANRPEPYAGAGRSDASAAGLPAFWVARLSGRVIIPASRFPKAAMPMMAAVSRMPGRLTRIWLKNRAFLGRHRR
jgi:hypothetical protein